MAPFMVTALSCCGEPNVARYFLHIANNSSITVDETGLELPDDESAISQGSRAAGQMLADELADWC